MFKDSCDWHNLVIAVFFTITLQVDCVPLGGPVSNVVLPDWIPTECEQESVLTARTPLYWLKFAAFYSKCLKEFPDPSILPTQTTQPTPCGNKHCRECMKPCKRSWSTLPECQASCSADNVECNRGCQIMYEILQDHSSLENSTSAPSMVSPAPITAKVTVKDFDVEWQRPNTAANQTILYVLFVNAEHDDKYTDFHPVAITFSTTVRHASGLGCALFSNFIGQEIEMHYKVIAVDHYGWQGDLETAKMSDSMEPKSPGSTVDNFHISTAPTYATQSFNSDRVNITVSWSKPAKLDQVTGFYIVYREETCIISFPTGSMSKYQITGPNISQAIVLLGNSFSDRLAGCNVSIKIYPLANCFRQEEAVTYFYYEGCHTLPNYPPAYVCVGSTSAPTTILNPIIDVITEGCFKNLDVNFSTEAPCFDCVCSTPYFNYTVEWFISSPSNNYIVEYGQLEPFFTAQKIVEPTRLLVKQEMYVVIPFLDPDLKYGMKVIGEGNGASINSELVKATILELKLDSPPTEFTDTPVTPTPKPLKTDSIGTPAIIGIAAGGIIFLIVIFLSIYCYKLKTRKLLDFGLDDQDGNFDLADFDKWEIPPQNIIVGEILGEGAFGKVYIGTVKGALLPYNEKVEKRNELTIKAAIKMLQPSAGEQQSYEFHEEIKLMKEIGQHKNVVNMLGCCTHCDPMCLIVEYMPNGDLLHYLRKRRRTDETSPYFTSTTSSSGTPYAFRDPSAQSLQQTSQQSLIGLNNTGYEAEKIAAIDSTCESDSLLPEDLLSFSWQIASGMEFLAGKGFVHRDLAARNILVGVNKCVKISDFGLSRLVYEEKMYTTKKNRRLPLKWMSTEAIFDQVFTARSDVWAYGVVLFEISTLGGTPYPTIDNRDLLRLLKSGYRMEKPDNCSEEIYKVMLKCWNEKPDDRPTFGNLREIFDEMLQEGSAYIDFNVDEKKDYYNVPSFASIENDHSESESETEGEHPKERRDPNKNETIANNNLVKNSLKPIESLGINQRYASSEVMHKTKARGENNAIDQIAPHQLRMTDEL